MSAGAWVLAFLVALSPHSWTDAGRSESDARSTPGLLVEDPAGDARQWTAGDAVYAASTSTCISTGLGSGPAAPACAAAYRESGTLRPVGGVPAHGAFDLLSVRMSDEPAARTFSIEVAEMPHDLASVAGADITAVQWEVWLTFEDGSWDWLSIFVSPHDPEPAPLADYARSCMPDPVTAKPCAIGCNYWWWCPYNVEADWEPGRPGRWTVIVPWQAIGAERSGLDVQASALVRTVHKAAEGSIEDAPQYRGGPAGLRFSAVALGSPQVPDSTVAGSSVQVHPVATMMSEAPTAWSDAPGDHEPNRDIHRVRWREEPLRIGMEFTLGAVEPGSHESVYFALGLPDGAVVDAWYTMVGGRRSAVAFLPLDPSYEESRSLPVILEERPGRPGNVTFWFDRTWLPRMEAGASIALLMTNTLHAPERTRVDLGAGGTLQDGADYVPGGDWLVGNAVPLRWSSSTREQLPPVMLDPAGDVQPGLASWDAGTAARFDLRNVWTVGSTPSATRFSLGFESFASVDVPATFDAMVYALSFATQSGEFMAGYYKHREGVQQFFCAPDTLAFGPAATDPRSVVWETIYGTYMLAGGPGATGSPGGIVLEVPHACLGAEQDGEFLVDQLTAGTWVMRDLPSGTALAQADGAASPGQVLFGTVPAAGLPASGAPSWYDAPLGIAGFWDITGVALAAAAAIGGAVLLRRRRRHFVRFLGRIDSAQHAAPVMARERLLVEIRDEAEDALRRSRVTDGQATVLERRIDRALAEARIAVASADFADLPYALVAEITRVLGDGRISARERRIVESLVKQAPLPDARKRKVLARVRAWSADS